MNSIAGKILLPLCKVDPINNDISSYIDHNPYLGHQVEAKIKELKSSAKITLNEENNFRERCNKFLFELFTQLKQRLPENIKTLEKIELFSLKNKLKANKLSLIALLEELGINSYDIPLIEQEYHKINLVPVAGRLAT